MKTEMSAYCAIELTPEEASATSGGVEWKTFGPFVTLAIATAIATAVASVVVHLVDAWIDHKFHC
ncbi:hypothetical protein GR217_29620 [Rhizobium leguminosarum]|uniref:Uncharacterized protein n=1 Tax=Rhizobium ruizarguesonis TaxID=2081791 RepID=A0AAE4YVF5_9HYPH|nr:hypothetical protein [Rhizobium ruizarguesonis]NEI51804.1 hypothetical protein [Rhizobium ruizarguesonis]